MTSAHRHRHSHKAHSAGEATDPAHVRLTAIAVLLGLAAAAVLVGLFVLWPRHRLEHAQASTSVSGVVRSSLQACQPNEGCVITVGIQITSGPDRGARTNLTFAPGATNPNLRTGEHIRMGQLNSGANAVYQFADIQRGRPLLLLGVLFAVVVIAVGRARGLAALAGLAFAGAVLVVFLLPAVLDGKSPTAVALVAGALITLVVLPISHGVSASTCAAVLGTLAGLGVAAVVSLLTVASLHVTGLSSEEAATVSLLGSKSSVGGILQCAVVIGALGVLNDVTVTQASAVFELAAGSELSRPQIFRAAMRIGRHHIASTVYSLVLAYAGSALPLLLIFSITGQSVTQMLTSDSIAPELAAALIGGAALALVVPFTSAIATGLTKRPV